MESINRYKLYFHLNPQTKEVFYVGIGIRSRHVATKNRTKLWTNYVNKNGFIALVIEDRLTVEEAKERERYFIRLYGRKDLGKGELLNLTDGGEGAFGAKRSSETRLKMSIAQKNRKKISLSESHKANISKALAGKKHSAEHIESNRKSKIEAYAKYSHMGMKGKHHSEETRRKISESNKRVTRTMPEEVIKRSALLRVGKPLSDETKRKIGEANRIKVAEYWRNRKAL